MTTATALALLIAVQQAAAAQTPVPRADFHAAVAPGAHHAFTTPPSGDTTGYWQQFVNYRMTATLDEPRASGAWRGRPHVCEQLARYAARDVLPAILNAFRPGSKWSGVDARENRVRFQDLKDPDYGYQRFTATPTFDGAPVAVTYPGAPDSTVAHFVSAAPAGARRLDPHSSAVGRAAEHRAAAAGTRGRSYDRRSGIPRSRCTPRRVGGHPFVPAGELYGEYGTYDVTLVVPEIRCWAPPAFRFRATRVGSA